MGSAGSAFGLIAGLLVLTGAAPACAQEADTRPVDQATGMRLPILPGERLVAFKNGCHAVLDAYDNPSVDAYYGKISWLGACHFGLADGPGYFIDENPNMPRKVSPVRYRFGQGLFNARASKDAQVLTYKPGSVFATSGMISVSSAIKRNEYMKDTPSLLDNVGAYAVDIVAVQSDKEADREVSTRLWVRRENCPYLLLNASMAKNLATISMDTPLAPAQTRLLTPFCQAAFDRAKAEGRLNGDSITWNNPYEKNTYGFFYVVLNEHSTTARQPGTDQWTSVPPAKPGAQFSDVTLCPGLTSLAACEPVWKALQAPYRAKLEDVRIKLELQGRQADIDRERRFAPLVAAWQQKVRDQAAAYSAQLQSERQAAQLKAAADAQAAAEAAAAEAAKNAPPPHRSPAARPALRRGRGK